MSRIVATFFYVGLLRPAPGTWGALAALPAFWLLHVLGGPALAVVGIAAAYALGHWATTVETARAGVEDPGWIVIDEVAGQWVALLPLSFGAAYVDVSVIALWPGWVGAFALFRLFDIWKPGPVGWADRMGNATGVMLDDVIAGLMAAVGVVVLAALAHGFVT